MLPEGQEEDIEDQAQAGGGPGAAGGAALATVPRRAELKDAIKAVRAVRSKISAQEVFVSTSVVLSVFAWVIIRH